MRLWAATRGGMVDGVYQAPAAGATSGRLVLATGAPRVNVSRAALGQTAAVGRRDGGHQVAAQAGRERRSVNQGRLRRPASGHQKRRRRGRDALSTSDDRRAQPRDHGRPEPRGGLGDRGQRRDHRSRSRSGVASVQRTRRARGRQPPAPAAAATERHSEAAGGGRVQRRAHQSAGQGPGRPAAARRWRCPIRRPPDEIVGQ